MTAIDTNTLDIEARRARRFARINKADAWFSVFGLSWMTPILKAAAGDNPRAQAGEIWRLLGVPLLAIAIFLTLWASLAPKVQTSLGAVPRPCPSLGAGGRVASGRHPRGRTRSRVL